MLQLITKLTKKRQFDRIYQYKDDPLKIQKKILLSIVRKNKNTEFGKNHFFSDVKKITDFQSRVPIRNHKSFKPLIDSVYQGEKNILTAENPYFFATTSGSTGKNKYIPITRSHSKEVNYGSLAYYHILEESFPGINNKKIQFIIQTGGSNLSPCGVPEGFVSGHKYKVLPKFIRNRFVIPYEVFAIEDLDAQLYCMARFLLEETNLGAIGSVSPLGLIQLGKTIENHGEKLIEDLFRGEISCKTYSPSQYLKSQVNKQKDTAEKLKKIFNRANKLMPFDVFPNLEVIACWMGGSMSYYIPELKRYFGDKPILELPFSATEGLFSIPYQPNTTGGITAITSHFLEFIHESEIDKNNPQTLTIDQLKINHNYYVLVTNSSGLYRYDMEDLIHVKDFWYRIPVIEFISKKSRIVSINNDQIRENDVTSAIYNACKNCKCTLKNFLFVPVLEAKRYRILIDSTEMDVGDVSSLKIISRSIEFELRKLATGYDDERSSKHISGLEVAIVKANQLKQYLASRSKSSKATSQTKPLHLSNDFNLYRQFDVIYSATSDD